MNPIQQPLFQDLMPRILPEKHYAWFRTANAHPSNHWKKHWWYPFKDDFMRKFAERDGYDLQIIEHQCWRCHGQGCASCEDGVYSRVEVPLQRWKFPDGNIYHKPAGYLPAGRPEIYKETLKGIIKHQEVSESTAIRSALKLFLRYDRQRFYSLVRVTYGDKYWLAQLGARTRNIRWKLYNARVCLMNLLFERDNGVQF